MIDRSVRQIKETGLPFFIWNEQLQKGSTFGERLANAVDAVFQKGFQKVVVMGNDCLSLTSYHIQSAARSLACNDAVLAPTKKGGVYLIGLTKNKFDKKSFIDIRWQCSSTCHDLQAWLSGNQIHTLPLKDDVNNYGDLLQQLQKLLKNNSVRLFIETILALSRIKFFGKFIFIRLIRPQYSFGITAPPSPFA